ncbi:F-box/kelch-repeat protein At3g23880-like [Quercus lobata]|uniref:F-box/kelch-repeat protein At3g23880-like n=1 Tax=Quercus lobata TaxID=97700 RepID=UPI0012486CA3|nr:F-box/kelch-repeat protein At3g23880-like [Quercus lobata]
MSQRNLPEEIVFEILARLPVKSLLRFRCVCNSWYSYITIPNFISTHLLCHNHDGGYAVHMPKTTVISPSLCRPHSQICTAASDRMFETVSEFRIHFTFQFGYPDFVSSCNGIMCLADYRPFKFKDVYLWNPSIRKFKRLLDTCLTQLCPVRLGFVYDSQNNDYKFVRISWGCPQLMPPLEVEVYSLSSDLYKRVELGILWRPSVVATNFIVL